MILGTAGHVDHGKTALVKALTGVDTDRLTEEKRRGITIDLGFAPLRLGDDLWASIVDVPGHEAFVRNMLAGATGIDLALLVVAADEGVMPQTVEHLAILTLLGIRGGVVALTKTDLVDAEWLELVLEDVRTAVASSPLAGAPVIPTSVVSGEGIDELRAALAAAGRVLPVRDADDLFRLPVDRAFTVRGTGTVVTGTVWSGTLERDTIVRLLPGQHSARVRSIETHGAPVARALPGTRAAIGLAGVEVGAVTRGTTLVSDAAWGATTTLLAEVALLDSAPRELGPRTAVRFHLGTLEVGARLVTTGGTLEPGTRAQARVVCDAPVVARAGDRFVLRSASPLVTIGGGVVNDPLPEARRARRWTRSASSALERLEAILAEVGVHGVALSSLPVRLGAAPNELPRVLASLDGRVRRIGDRLYATATIAELAQRLVASVDEYHARSPLELGVPLQLVRTRLGADIVVVEVVLREQMAAGVLDVTGSLVSRRGWTPVLTPTQARVRRELLSALQRAGREAPDTGELTATFGPDAVALLRNLERDGAVVHVEAERYYAREVIEMLSATLRKRMTPGQEYSPSELREILGVSRKYLIPLLEYCDRSGITERRTTGRVVKGS